jgi:hypothetical protein
MVESGQLHVLYLKRVAMTKKRVTIKDKKLRALLKEGGRKGAQKDFFELLRRAVKTTSNS